MRFILLLLLFVVIALPLRAEDADAVARWPGFRGPSGLAVTSEAVPLEWDLEEEEDILWRSEIDTPGASSPVVWDSRVFLTGGEPGQGVVVCVDARTGNESWRGRVPLHGEPSMMDEATTYAPATPVTDGEKVYAVFVTGAVAAFDMTGAMRWMTDLGLPEMNYGYASSPVLHEGKLFVQLDKGGEGGSELIALDARTGDPLWRVKRDLGASWASPAIVTAGDQIQVVLVSDRGIAAYAPKDGRELWRVECRGTDVAPSPALAGDRIIASPTADGTRAISLDGKVLWHNQDVGDEVASPVATDSHVFLITFDALYCLDAKTGEQKKEVILEGTFYASPILADDQLVVVNREGRMTIHKADETLETLKTVSFEEKVDATPALAGGVLYVRTESSLIAIGEED